jgi:ribosomal protein L1
LGVDPKKSDQMVRGVVSLPHGIGKTVRVLVLCTPDKVQDAKMLVPITLVWMIISRRSKVDGQIST